MGLASRRVFFCSVKFAVIAGICARCCWSSATSAFSSAGGNGCCAIASPVNEKRAARLRSRKERDIVKPLVGMLSDEGGKKVGDALHVALHGVAQRAGIHRDRLTGGRGVARVRPAQNE